LPNLKRQPERRAAALLGSRRASRVGTRLRVSLGLFRRTDMNAADHSKFKRAYRITTNDVALGADRAEAFTLWTELAATFLFMNTQR